MTKEEMQELREIITEAIDASEARMTTKLEASETRMTAKLEASETRMTAEIKTMQKDIAEIKESLEEIRDSTNRLLEWADEVGERPDLKLPKII